jgi:hypothetical protein
MKDQLTAAPSLRSEATFIASIQQDLERRFPHARDAIGAGYVRYTSEDYTGAISYANRSWTSDPAHPSRLWTTSKAIFSAQTSRCRARTENLDPSVGCSAWALGEFDGHVHWVPNDDATGEMIYDRALWNANWLRSGGSLTYPSAETVVTVFGALEASDVVTVLVEERSNSQDDRSSDV